MRKLLSQMQNLIQNHDLLQRGDRVVVGLSGGSDSTALLILLSKLRKKLNLNLITAHLNHGFSGISALKHEKFCRLLATKMDVPFYSKRIHLRELAKKNLKSLEEMGRELRYQFFREIAKKERAKKIATAHTLDDQAETILMRFIRGTGLRGLGGIPVIRQDKEFFIIRPLLGTSKKELTAYLKKIKQPYCKDKTNRLDIFTRNRVRNTLLPWIEKNLNPQVKRAILDVGQICQDSSNLSDHLAEIALKQCLKVSRSNEVVLDIFKLQKLAPAVRSQVLLRVFSLLSPHRQQVSTAHLRALQKILKPTSSVGSALNLPYHLKAIRGSQELRIFDTSRE